MKPVVGTTMVVCGAALFMIAGCANKEVVKSEEPIAVKSEASRPAAAATARANASDTSRKQAAGNEAAQAKQTADGASRTSAHQVGFEAIYFNFDQADLSRDARDILGRNAAAMLKARPDVKVRIEGNCDDRGSAEYNLALGERRATAALKYLETMGVPAGRLSVVSYGKEHPAVQGEDEAAWAKNRRDDFVIATP